MEVYAKICSVPYKANFEKLSQEQWYLLVFPVWLNVTFMLVITFVAVE